MELAKQEWVYRNSWKWRIGSIFVELVVLLQNVFKSPLSLSSHVKLYLKSIAKTEFPSAINTSKDLPRVLTRNFDFEVGGILDEFTSSCLNYEVKLDLITPGEVTLDRVKNWKFFLVESAWKGNFGSWTGLLGKYLGNNRKELKEVLKLCREANVPTIFWNKEDPVHFEHFIDCAKLFDVVFTTDKNKIEDYTRILNHTNVHYLGFVAQPRLHYPKDENQRLSRVCFAGSYWSNRYPERGEWTDRLLRASKPYGLDIYDRNLFRLGNQNDYQFPKEFQENIVGTAGYDKICEIYRAYKVFINVNSVNDSPTMVSRRIYELLASGTPIVSSPSLAIERNLKGVVFVANDEQSASDEIRKLLESKSYWEERSLLGIKFIEENLTYKNLVNNLILSTQQLLNG